MPLTEQTYRAVVVEDEDGQWELWCGRLREKPAMTADHNRFGMRLTPQLGVQLDSQEFEVRVNSSRLRRPNGMAFIPDVVVVPTALVEQLINRIDTLETYDPPVPFVAEVWSPSTGTYDVDTKFAEYRERGDQEIWRIHPYERTLTVWRRQADGTYEKTFHTAGRLTLRALPQVTIDLDLLLR
jgi:Uma2 family endonuclease